MTKDNILIYPGITSPKRNISTTKTIENNVNIFIDKLAQDKFVKRQSQPKFWGGGILCQRVYNKSRCAQIESVSVIKKKNIRKHDYPFKDSKLYRLFCAALREKYQ